MISSMGFEVEEVEQTRLVPDRADPVGHLHGRERPVLVSRRPIGASELAPVRFA